MTRRGIPLSHLPPEKRKELQAAARDAAYLERERFIQWCEALGLPVPIPELKFHPRRKWRFDWAWTDQKVALEIEGGAFTGGRHTRGAGFVRDMEKYSEAAALGWRILRCTPRELFAPANTERVRRALEIGPC